MPNDAKLPPTFPANSTDRTDNSEAVALFDKGMAFRNANAPTAWDSDQARRFLLAAAEFDHAEAQFELCLLLSYYGEWPEAIAWLEKSVALGFGPAQRFLARETSNPLILEHLSKSYDSSHLYRQASAWHEEWAKAGDAEAQYNFALMHWDQEAITPNSNTALLWIKKAAEQDHVFACSRLSDWLLDDKSPHRNIEQGVFWLTRAAELGKSHECGRLGDLYLFGHTGGRYNRDNANQIVTPDKRLAVSWYERQIAIERKRGYFMGTDSLARLYLVGDQLDQDIDRAEEMLLHAAKEGYLDSQRLLAAEYITGKRLKKDHAAVLHWLTTAEQNPRSYKLRDQYQLGHFYEHDSNDAPNYAEAIKWYDKAARNGDYMSQKRLGAIFEAGLGRPKNYVQAYKWYLLAVANSCGKAGIKSFHATARQTRNALAAKMTPEQREEASELALTTLRQVMSLRPADYERAREGLEEST